MITGQWKSCLRPTSTPRELQVNFSASLDIRQKGWRWWWWWELWWWSLMIIMIVMMIIMMVMIMMKKKDCSQREGACKGRGDLSEDPRACWGQGWHHLTLPPIKCNTCNTWHVTSSLLRQRLASITCAHLISQVREGGEYNLSAFSVGDLISPANLELIGAIFHLIKKWPWLWSSNIGH